MLQWVGILKSSPIGDDYKIKLTYELGKNPTVFVLEPAPLKLAKGKTSLPHVYDHKNSVCVYTIQIGRNGIALNLLRKRL